MNLVLKNRHFKRNVVILISSVLVIAAATVGLLWYFGGQRENQKNTAPTTTNTNSLPPAQSTNTDTTPNTAGNTAEDTKSNTAGGSSTGSIKNVNVTVTSVDQTQPNMTIISAYASTVVASGTCTFTFTQGTKTFSRTTQTLQNSTTSPCDTLSLRNVEFPSPGTWQLVVSFLSGNMTGASSSQPVVLK